MSTQISDDQEKIHQLMNELPQADGWWQPKLFLYQGYWLFPRALLCAIKMHNPNHFKPHSSDIFLCSFMKSGTTWLRALMFSTLNRSQFDFSDHPLLRHGPHDCFPQFEVSISDDNLATNLKDLPSPRLIATHLSHTMLPSSFKDRSSGCKFVYVCRDPKDVFVSKFHFLKKLRSSERPPLSIDQAFETFCEGVSEYGPYWDHVLEFWNASIESPDKILFLKYEEIKISEAVGGVHGCAHGISAEEDENGVVEKIVTLCSFKHLKNLDVNKKGIHVSQNLGTVENELFFRKGEIGDWKNHLTKEMEDRIDQITRDKFKGSGLTIGSTLK